jgi:hypothetical protein
VTALRSRHPSDLARRTGLLAACVLAGLAFVVSGCGSKRSAVTVAPATSTVAQPGTSAHTTTAVAPATPKVETGAAMQIGVVANAAGYGESRKQLVLATGIKLIREDRGDYAVAWAHAHGINCIGIIFMNPDSPGTGCDEIELDNEPYWANVDPRAWARQALAVAKALRARGIEKPILLPLLALEDGSTNFDGSGDYTYDGVTKPWVQWLNEAAPELWRYVDGFAIHPYTLSGPPRFNAIDAVRAELNAIPDARAKPFWVTEIGWPTGPASDAAATTEGSQAVFLQLFINAMRARKDVAAVVVYNLVDLSPEPYTAIIDAYGLIHTDGSPKPALAVVEQEARASEAAR